MQSPPPGAHEVLRTTLADTNGVVAIVSDVVVPPNGALPRHFHPGEELVYIIDGSSVYVEDGKPDLLLKTGDVYAIPPRTVHAPRGGPEGARAISIRIIREGEQEYVFLNDNEAAPGE
ncbi:MAG: cupin domain-containing protein [Parvularculaceae bacterium]